MSYRYLESLGMDVNWQADPPGPGYYLNPGTNDWLPWPEEGDQGGGGGGGEVENAGTVWENFDHAYDAFAAELTGLASGPNPNWPPLPRALRPYPEGDATGWPPHDSTIWQTSDGTWRVQSPDGFLTRICNQDGLTVRWVITLPTGENLDLPVSSDVSVGGRLILQNPVRVVELPYDPMPLGDPRVRQGDDIYVREYIAARAAGVSVAGSQAIAGAAVEAAGLGNANQDGIVANTRAVANEIATNSEPPVRPTPRSNAAPPPEPPRSGVPTNRMVNGVMIVEGIERMLDAAATIQERALVATAQLTSFMYDIKTRFAGLLNEYTDLRAAIQARRVNCVDDPPCYHNWTLMLDPLFNAIQVIIQRRDDAYADYLYWQGYSCGIAGSYWLAIRYGSPGQAVAPVVNQWTAIWNDSADNFEQWIMACADLLATCECSGG